MEAENNPEDDTMGTRTIPFTREIFIERDDFMEGAPSKFFRMDVGREVRLKNAYIVKCESITKDANGEITEIHVITSYSIHYTKLYDIKSHYCIHIKYKQRLCTRGFIMHNMDTYTTNHY